MVKYIKRFVLMVQFLTTIPVRVKLDANEEDFGKGLVFAPVIGLIIGGILAAVRYLAGLAFPAFVSAVITIVAYILLTGGLHLDGLGDTFDGLFSNRSRERMLEIMRDSRVGTNAVLVLVSVLLLDISLVACFKGRTVLIVLLLMPVAGRVGSLVGSVSSGYARSGEGLGKSFIEHCGTRELVAGLAAYFLMFFAAAGLRGLAVSIVPPLSTLVANGLFKRKIGGATGDTLGAVCEINQTVFLLAAFLLTRLF